MDEVRKTWKEWENILLNPKGIKIIDPDGFRNEPDGYDKIYTESEFNKRTIVCTICSSSIKGEI